jgi:hypothetical protein
MAEDRKSWINVQADTEIVMMLDQMVYEAAYETDRSKYIRGMIRQEFARQHPEIVRIEELPRPAGSKHVVPLVVLSVPAETEGK